MHFASTVVVLHNHMVRWSSCLKCLAFLDRQPSARIFKEFAPCFRGTIRAWVHRLTPAVAIPSRCLQRTASKNCLTPHEVLNRSGLKTLQNRLQQLMASHSSPALIRCLICIGLLQDHLADSMVLVVCWGVLDSLHVQGTSETHPGNHSAATCKPTQLFSSLFLKRNCRQWLSSHAMLPVNAS